jgi:hypothetical protein
MAIWRGCSAATIDFVIPLPVLKPHFFLFVEEPLLPCLSELSDLTGVATNK